MVLGELDQFGSAGATALSLILIEVVKTGRAYIKDVANWSEDVFKLGLRMSTAIDRTDTIRNIYFGATEGTQASIQQAGDAPFPIFDKLKPETKVNVIALMQQYHDVVLLKYTTLHAAYNLASSQEDPTSTSQKNKILQPSWIFGGKKKVQEMIGECEQWNDKLFEIIQIYIMEQSLQLLAAKSVPSLPSGFNKLKTNSDVKALGLSEEMDLIQISEDGDTGWKALAKFTRIVFDDESRAYLKSGTFDGRRVMGEFKVFQPQGKDYQNSGFAEPTKEVLERIRLLAVLLSRQHSIRSRLLRCTGFYHDEISPSYVFILEYPRGRLQSPIPLEAILSGKRKCKKPPLESRLKLALTLAIALFQFHTVGWVHKSFKSSNILLFPSEPNDVLCPSDLTEPWLAGFEYARQDPGFSEELPLQGIDVANDIYRHPDRWGQPTRKFGKMHDIYSLGITLLEIGMWQDIKRFDAYGFTRIERRERFDIQALFVQQASDKLPFMAGTAYADVVVKCLTGQFDNSELEEGQGGIGLEELYRKQIIGGLRRVSERL